MTVADNVVLRASARWVDPNGSDVVNVWFFVADFVTPQADQDVFDAVDQYLENVFVEFESKLIANFDPLDLKVDVVAWDSEKWQVIQNVGFGSWGAGISTVAVADALPPGASALGYLRTGLGKHGGKKFFAGFGTASLTNDGNVDVGTTSTIVLGLTELLTPFIISASNELIAVVLDHLDGTIREIIEIGASAVFAYQRRRRPGTGS